MLSLYCQMGVMVCTSHDKQASLQPFLETPVTLLMLAKLLQICQRFVLQLCTLSSPLECLQQEIHQNDRCNRADKDR